MCALNDKGFTLLEMLIVIAIFAIGSAIALPNIMDMGRMGQVKTEARQLKDQLARARAMAIEQNGTVAVTFAAQSYTIADKTISLTSATINAMPANMSWDNRGYPSAATTITLIGANKTFTVTVTQAGSISIN